MPHHSPRLRIRRISSHPAASGVQLDLWPIQAQPQPTASATPITTQTAPAPAYTHTHQPALPPPAPLRIVRIVNPAQTSRGTAPYLRLCGRLTDVCAELDRLAAAEARAA